MNSWLIVWALPAGATDRLHERPIAETCRTQADVEAVKAAAGRDGWHSFRVVPFSDGDRPDFAGAVA